MICLPTPVVIPVGSWPITETRKQIDDCCLLNEVKEQKSAAYSDGNVNWRHACARHELEHHHVTHQVKMFTTSIRPGSVSLLPVAGAQVLDRSWGALKKFLSPRMGAKCKLKGHSCLHPAVKQMLICGAGELLLAHNLQMSPCGTSKDGSDILRAQRNTPS